MTDPIHSGNDGIPQHAADELAAEGIPDVVELVSRPEPVLDAAALAGAIAGAIIAIGSVLRVIGWASDTDFEAVAEAVSNAVFAVAALWALIGPWIIAKTRARPKVTPLADPRDILGRKLVPLIRNR